MWRMFSFSRRQIISPAGKVKDVADVFFFPPANHFTSRKSKRCGGCFLFPAGKSFHQLEKQKMRRMFSFSRRQIISPAGKVKNAADVFFFRRISAPRTDISLIALYL